MEGGYAESNLGTLALRSEKRPDLAQAAFERAQAHFLAAQRLAPTDTGVVRDLADNHGWLSDSLYDQHKFERAHAERSRERALMVGLAEADPKNANYARDLVESAIGLARIEIAQNRRAEALARLRETKRVVDDLSARDPANKRTARLAAAVALYLASLVADETPRSDDATVIIAVALKACAAAGALAGTTEQKRMCEHLRTGESRVSMH